MYRWNMQERGTHGGCAIESALTDMGRLHARVRRMQGFFASGVHQAVFALMSTLPYAIGQVKAQI